MTYFLWSLERRFKRFLLYLNEIIYSNVIDFKANKYTIIDRFDTNSGFTDVVASIPTLFYIYNTSRKDLTRDNN